MDFFFPYRNPNFQSSSLDTTNNKTSNSFNGNEVERKQQRNKRTNNKMTTKAKLSTDPQSVAARERRHRISEKFKILRSLIPGGDTKNMDTVSMLEEAIQYVKHLKSQIWLHQTMISFENFAGYNNHENLVGYNNHDASRNDNNHVASRNGNHLDQCPHQGFPHFDHFYGEYNHHEMLPQLGFADGASFKVEDEDHMVSVSHDHQHHHGMYP